ncbi:hypothetical protein LY76DRAFT_649804 [Colletotrichum caudatum]|nr:hypothetical protein LY76DRAFT_649804 [Colletotrichum caudatum]
MVQRVAGCKLGQGIYEGATKGSLINAAAVPHSDQQGHNRTEVAHNKTFGPRATITSLGTEAEAGRLANATEKGVSV